MCPIDSMISRILAVSSRCLAVVCSMITNNIYCYGEKQMIGKSTIVAVAVMVIIASLFIAQVSDATVLRKMDVSVLSDEAGNIVMGVVEAVKTKLDEKSGRVYTYTTIRVKENLKGKAEEVIILRQMGGSYNGLEMRIAGTPYFEANQEVMLFLKKDAGNYFLRGMGQGAFRIELVHGVKMARQLTGHAAVFEPGQNGDKGQIVHAEELTMPLADLKLKVMSFVNIKKH